MLPESQAFELAVTRTIEIEGDSSDDKTDKGGATKYGISRAFLQSISSGPVSSAFVMGLSLSDAKEIYRTHFWYKPKIHRIPDDRLREVVFDQAVNRGSHTAVVNLQKAIIKVSKESLAVDGVLGPRTIAAIQGLDAEGLRLAYMRESQLSYVTIAKNDVSQLKYLLGWISRTWTYI